MTTHPELQAIYQDVLKNPDDDLPRLAYADWLEEFGQDDYSRDRAAFIRSQIEDANPPPCDKCGAFDPKGCIYCICSKGSRHGVQAAAIRRHINHPEWMDGLTGFGSQENHYLQKVLPVLRDHSETDSECPHVRFVRGFPFSMRLPWDAVRGIGAILVSRLPIQKLFLPGMEPAITGDDDLQCAWVMNQADDCRGSWVSPELFSYLQRGRLRSQTMTYGSPRTMYVYQSSQVARDDLNDACMRMARIMNKNAGGKHAHA